MTDDMTPELWAMLDKHEADAVISCRAKPEDESRQFLLRLLVNLAETRKRLKAQQVVKQCPILAELADCKKERDYHWNRYVTKEADERQWRKKLIEVMDERDKFKAERADANRAVLNLSHDFKHLRAAAEAMVAEPGGRGPTLEQALRDIEEARSKSYAKGESPDMPKGDE